MSELFLNKAGEQLLTQLRLIFQQKRIYHAKTRPIMFVCGGDLSEGAASLRKQFTEWAGANLSDFVCLMAEEALKQNLDESERTFVNLATFESVIADIADCVLIFPEGPGSYAETGFFANSRVRNKALVINKLSLQAAESFLNLGPIETISSYSFLKPTVLVNAPPGVDFTDLAQRLRQRVVPLQHRQSIPYQRFGKFNFKQKLLIVFEVLRLLRLADVKTLRYVLQECFGGSPKYQELKHLLRILLAAKFIQRQGDTQYFKVTPDLVLVEIEHLEVEKMFSVVNFFYQKYSQELYGFLQEVAS